jgi:hypothetical protein
MRIAWLALLLLGSISAVAAMLTGSWRAPDAAEATPDQTIASAAQVEPADDNAVKAPNWPDLAARQDSAARQEVAARQAVDPDPAPVLRGAELPAAPFPAAAETMASANASANMNLTSRHWHGASAKARMATANVANAQQIKRIRDSKAEMRARRSKAAANTRTTCTPSTNEWTNLLRKLTLLPHCTI